MNEIFTIEVINVEAAMHNNASLTLSRPGVRGTFHPQGGLGLLAGLMEKFIIFLYF